MSSDALSSASPGGLARPAADTPAAKVWHAPDTRRALQLALAFIWLLDAILQFQSFMFTTAFSKMLADTASGNPRVIADPITWSARIIGEHPGSTNAAFATIQLLLGLGIAWRPTVKAALAASVAWSLGVWWLGEGLGGVLDGAANPVNGAPGAVILYALLAVLLWPARELDPVPTAAAAGRSARFVAARPVGALPARILWLVLWGSLAYFAVVPSTGADGLHDMISGMEGSNPGWLNSLLRVGASAVAGHGDTVSAILAVLLGIVAVGIFLPAPTVRAVLVLAVVVSLAIWVFGEALGAIFSGQGTDVNTGPLLILIAAAYWPLRQRGAAPPAALTGEVEEG
ncbi:MAG TPA: hypothetical protein VGM10_13885 [Actinocrinis sp.]|jgi:hypothetical protein